MLCPVFKDRTSKLTAEAARFLAKGDCPRRKGYDTEKGSGCQVLVYAAVRYYRPAPAAAACSRRACCKRLTASLSPGLSRTASFSSTIARDVLPRFRWILPNSRWAVALSGSFPTLRFHLT